MSEKIAITMSKRVVDELTKLHGKDAVETCVDVFIGEIKLDILQRIETEEDYDKIEVKISFIKKEEGEKT